ncbi:MULTISPECIES: YraN family protein [unclassified Clostridioides]|uniref:YraN family protein n=1 Tax=unclassified Clostridioides TaxID=2635829 RepID=UPI001D1296AA|nr:YraN family protein [Clostridioides sp. ZZV15-6388]MCC0644023.1 YraN family protein [Clostridioides sp. ZZV14-6150]MCC0659727.1 YraN family protein [Clostridioides sp. ZZV14-6154]MCC0666489.1 YraN family protein [Clostridioides sp. ZZV15-6597]MCC0666758.1 YraN family protein [Clostridioides sp. ZZV14-6153]MCC0717780.1 YraN family protein [Clostridioides sp. ZZV14-6105]MCC0722879.1 YraN family protein [Clostridioides sp. ZZV14-6104]MCC0728190.1 YraN family protein [Clostridioides sp. ZZV14
MNNKEKGDFGEEVAINYLLSKGAKLLEKNYRLKIGEVDIIVRMDDEIVFVEVKSRSNLRYGYPCESVNFKKRKKIVEIAKYYITKNNLHNIPIRFDVVEVYLSEKRVNHIMNAF